VSGRNSVEVTYLTRADCGEFLESNPVYSCVFIAKNTAMNEQVKSGVAQWEVWR